MTLTAVDPTVPEPYADSDTTVYIRTWPFYLPRAARNPHLAAPLAARPALVMRPAARHAGREPSGSPGPHRGSAPCAGGPGHP